MCGGEGFCRIPPPGLRPRELLQALLPAVAAGKPERWVSARLPRAAERALHAVHIPGEWKLNYTVAGDVGEGGSDGEAAGGGDGEAPAQDLARDQGSAPAQDSASARFPATGTQDAFTWLQGCGMSRHVAELIVSQTMEMTLRTDVWSLLEVAPVSMNLTLGQKRRD